MESFLFVNEANSGTAVVNDLILVRSNHRSVLEYRAMIERLF